MANDKVLVHSDYRDDPLKLLDRAHMDYVPWLDAMHQVHRGQDAPDIPITRTSQVEALINSGRCLWVCPTCNSVTPVEDRPATTPVGSTGTGATWDLTPTPAHYGHPSICVQCGSDWVDVMFPTNRAAIEAELMKQPGHRGFAPVRNWQPGWTLEYLQERTTRANVLRAAGVEFVRALSVGTPRLWSVGEILTASNMNTYISDILDDLKGTNGPIEYTDAIVVDSLTTTERDALTAVNGMVIYNSTLNVFQRYENGVWASYNDLAAMTIASAAQGDVFIRGATAIQRLGAGTAQQIFRTGGIGANPAWQDLIGTKIAGTTTRSSILYEDASGNAARLVPPTASGNNALISGTSTTNPSWLAFTGVVTLTEYTTAGTHTWTRPAGTHLAFIECVGGGAGGHGGNTGAGGGGGARKTSGVISGINRMSGITAVVGAGGGAGGASIAASLGTDGGNSSAAAINYTGGPTFTTLVANGGVVGVTSRQTAGANGTVQSGGAGGGGGRGGQTTTDTGRNGGGTNEPTVAGGVGGTTTTAATAGGNTTGDGAGGGGGGGAAGNQNDTVGYPGAAGGTPGGGGGGGGLNSERTPQVAGAGGAGGTGVVRIWAW